MALSWTLTLISDLPAFLFFLATIYVTSLLFFFAVLSEFSPERHLFVMVVFRPSGLKAT